MEQARALGADEKDALIAESQARDPERAGHYRFMKVVAIATLFFAASNFFRR